jgi:hypothetical protein
LIETVINQWRLKQGELLRRLWYYSIFENELKALETRSSSVERDWVTRWIGLLLTL